MTYLQNPVSPPPFQERKPLVRRRYRTKSELDTGIRSIPRIGNHIVSQPGAQSGPVNTLGRYIISLPPISFALTPRERKIFTTPQQLAASARRWTGDYHPSALRELSDLIPIEMLNSRQRTNTTAVVFAATALIFSHQATPMPFRAEARILKRMVSHLEGHIPRRFFKGKPGTRMELFLRGVRRFLLHLTPKEVIILDDENAVRSSKDFNRMPIVKIEETDDMPPEPDFDFNDLDTPSAPPWSRKRGRDDADERPTKRSQPGQALSPRHGAFLAAQYHPGTETAGLKQLLELAGLGTADVEKCLRLMAQGMSAKTAMVQLGKRMRLPV